MIGPHSRRSFNPRPALETKIAALLDRKYPNLEMQSAADAKDEVSGEINRTFNMFNDRDHRDHRQPPRGHQHARDVGDRAHARDRRAPLGASRWQVRSTMLDESLMITVAGAVVGVAAGTLIGFAWLCGVTT
jgi:hypothetical protein